MQQHMTKDQEIAQLTDQRRALAAQLAGVDLQIAMAAGDRDAARRHMKEMYEQANARRAARFVCEEEGAH